MGIESRAVEIHLDWQLICQPDDLDLPSALTGSIACPGVFMRFMLLDDILEQSDERIVAVKQVSLAEEYLKDHFATFPVLPGVFMVEAMVQAARVLLAPRGDDRLVLGEVRALKFGTMVKPGERLLVEVTFVDQGEDGSCRCRGVGKRLRPGESPGQGVGGETAVSGRFTMRPLRLD